MKLLELLVRELPEWPDSLGVFTQDMDMSIWFYEFCRLDNGRDWDDETALSQKILKLNEIATDHDTAIITKEMWESAK